jgi:hypothetical protein
MGSRFSSLRVRFESLEVLISGSKDVNLQFVQCLGCYDFTSIGGNIAGFSN